jgi:hypothetical protein
VWDQSGDCLRRIHGGCKILDKGINKLCKGYLREEFEQWTVKNGSHCHPNRGEVAHWVKVAWDKVKISTTVNNW